MGYLTVKQFSERWGITERRIIKLCKENRIDGAIKNGMVWMIPEDTMKPSDRRNKISKYINTQKSIMIVNFNNEMGYSLIPFLKKDGYIVKGIYFEESINQAKLKDIKYWKVNYENQKELEETLNEAGKYYEGLIFIDMNNTVPLKDKEWFIRDLAKKMGCEASIVLVNHIQNKNEKLEVKLASELKENIGVRINTINIDAPIQKNILVNYAEIAEDILAMLTKFKNTTGMSIITDGDYLEFDKTGRTRPLEIGKFYRAITNYFKSLNKESYMWCASTMLEDEWTEEPLEMNFRVQNLDAANRGAIMDRIFIFSKDKIKEFKDNKTLKIYMQSNINTMFVDYDEIKTKEPELLEIVGDGWDGINKETLIVDLPAGSKARGYVSINKDEVQKAYDCFQRLKKYAKDLKEILK